jgi:hypothetical protein
MRKESEKEPPLVLERRIRILQLLAEEPHTARELADAVGLTDPGGEESGSEPKHRVDDGDEGTEGARGTADKRGRRGTNNKRKAHIPTWRHTLYEDTEVLRSIGFDVRFNVFSRKYEWRNTPAPFYLYLSDSQLLALTRVWRTFEESKMPFADGIRDLVNAIISRLPAGTAEQVERAKAKPDLVIQLHEVSDYTNLDPDLLTQIRGALRRGYQLELKYRSPQHDKAVTHLVALLPESPLVYKRGHVYLPAHKQGKPNITYFRLDRIVAGSVMTRPIPAEAGNVPSVKIRYWLDAELVRGGSAALFPGAQIDMQPDGSAMVTAHTTDLWEARLMLLSYGAGCKVLEPPQLVKDVQAEVLKMARHYGVNLSDGGTLERNMTEQQRSRSEG